MLLALAVAASHWPLTAGGRWEMTAKFSKSPMVFEVVGESGGVVHVRWDNPWVKAEFGFRPMADRVELATLDMGQGVATFPAGTTYFDFSKPRGGTWSNALGSFTLTGRDRTIHTPAGRFDNCVEIRARDSKGADTYWTFAPGVGPVQFGQGGGAFFLARHNGTALAASAPTQAPAPTAQTPSGRTWIAIDANPPPNEGYSRQAKEVRARMAREAGATFLYYAPKWSEMEPSPGTFQFGELDEKIAIAEQNDWPVALNIRTIDTHRRSMPAAYEGLAWTDARMADRLADLLRQVSAHTRGRVRWLTIGNEVNDYFKSRKGEVGGYAQLVRRVSSLARQLFPGAEISVNFTWFAMGDLGRDYKALVDASDFVSLTYYPLNADISFRAPDTVGGDVANMARFAGGKRVFLQEVGYASSSRIASEQRQADFVANLFAALRANPSVVAANFVWMSDLPDSVVDDLTRHYDLERNSNFREYLATLGYFDKNGRAKPAWEVLRREASRLR